MQKTSKKNFQSHSKPPLWIFRYTMTIFFYLNHSFIIHKQHIKNPVFYHFSVFHFSEIFWSAQSHFATFVKFSLVGTVMEHHFDFSLYFQNPSHIHKSSHWRCSVRKGVHKNFSKFIRKHLRQSLFLNKVAG